MGKTHRQAICPVCGTAHGTEVTETIPGKPYMVLARRNYWERTKDFDPNKPFGVIQEVGMGRGRSFKVLGYFSPEEDKDGFFPLVKNRLLQAVKEWRAKGWITEDEVKELCEYIPPAKPTPRQKALPIPEATPGMPEAVTPKVTAIVYHGGYSPPEIDIKVGKDVIYFTDDLIFAEQFAQKEKGRTYAAQLDLKNPFVISEHDYVKYQGTKKGMPSNTELKQRGYDGFIINNNDGTKTYGVFSKEQVKEVALPIPGSGMPKATRATPPARHEVPEFGEEGAIGTPTPPDVAKAGRRRVIEARLKRGEPVSDKLLAEFPDLQIPEPGKPEATPLHEAPVPRGQPQGYHLLHVEGYSYELKPKRGWYFKNKWIGYNASDAFKHREMREKGLAE